MCGKQDKVAFTFRYLQKACQLITLEQSVANEWIQFLYLGRFINLRHVSGLSYNVGVKHMASCLCNMKVDGCGEKATEYKS